jgi:hypothetical protein
LTEYQQTHINLLQTTVDRQFKDDPVLHKNKLDEMKHHLMSDKGREKLEKMEAMGSLWGRQRMIMVDYRKGGPWMGIVSQRYLPCLYCMQGCNLKVHYKISTLRFAEVVFCSETLHT